MPGIKRITLATAEGTGLTVYAIIRREADGWMLDDAGGAFGAAPADPYVSLAEHATIKALYERDESRAAWNDGGYIITAYMQAGGSPVPASDTVIAAGRMQILSDTEVVVDAPVSSRVTPAELTAATANLDAAVSTRATPGDIAGAVTTGVLQSQVTVTSGPQVIQRGDVKKLVLNAGPQWNMTGKDVYLCVKSDPAAADATAIVDRKCTITDAANGVAEITLTADETAVLGSYHAEYEMRNAGAETDPQTIMQFNLIIRQDVRQGQ